MKHTCRDVPEETYSGGCGFETYMLGCAVETYIGGCREVRVDDYRFRMQESRHTYEYPKHCQHRHRDKGLNIHAKRSYTRMLKCIYICRLVYFRYKKEKLTAPRGLPRRSPTLVLTEPCVV